jgi:Glucanosyltransferase
VFDSSVGGAAEIVNCGDPVNSFNFLIFGRFLDANSYCINETTLFQNNIIQQYESYSIPTILAYGCETGRQHDFKEVQTIYNNDTVKVFSGGIVQDWYDDPVTGANLGKPLVNSAHKIAISCLIMF